MLEKPAPGGSETPWGVPWAALLSSLRPTAEEADVVSSAMSRLRAALSCAPFHGVVVPGGAYGKGTLVRGGAAPVDVYAVVRGEFRADAYHETHLRPLLDALSAARDPPFADVRDRGLAVEACVDGVRVRVRAAGVLRGGPKELLCVAGGDGAAGGAGGTVAEVRAVLEETAGGVLRVKFVEGQCELYKDMVRVGKKWRDEGEWSVPAARPGDYLVELLMLEAFMGAPAVAESPDVYAGVFRRFLGLVCAAPGRGAGEGGDDMPRTFLTWGHYYNRGVVDYCLGAGLLRMPARAGTPDDAALVVVDPAVPYVDVAAGVREWGEARAHARAGLAAFTSTEMVQVLDVRLRNFSEAVEKTLKGLSSKLDALEGVDRAPRRWAGQVQFRDAHLGSDAWTPVVEMELRTLKWVLHARRPRVESTGYHQSVDVSLQLVGGTERQLDVDIAFRGTTTQVKFDASTDHVLVARRSEVMRNRDYPLQVTVVS